MDRQEARELHKPGRENINVAIKELLDEDSFFDNDPKNFYLKKLEEGKNKILFFPFKKVTTEFLTCAKISDAILFFYEDGNYFKDDRKFKKGVFIFCGDSEKFKNIFKAMGMVVYSEKYPEDKLIKCNLCQEGEW